MPFLAPVIPAITGAFTGAAGLGAGIARAGIGLGGSLLASKLAGGNPPGYGNALNLSGQAQQQGMNLSNQLAPQGQNLLSLAGQTYNPVINYWSNLLNNNRGAMTSALGPDISRIGQGFQTAAQTSANLNPRTGPSAAFLSQLPFQQQAAVTQLMQGMRPLAAQQMLQAGQAAGATGSNILANATNLLYGSTQTGRGIMEAALQKQYSDRNLGTQLGQGLYNVMNRPYAGGGTPGNVSSGQILQGYYNATPFNQLPPAQPGTEWINTV